MEKKLKKYAIEFLCTLEGYHQTLKMLHWSTSNYSQHLLCDKMDEEILEFEDSIAEVTMGLLGTKYGIGDLKALLPEAKTIDALLKELKTDVITFKNNVGDDAEVSGIQNILDDFMTSINKWNYLKTLS